jgi:hypothetical protein
MVKAIRHDNKETQHVNLQGAFNAIRADMEDHFTKTGSLPGSHVTGASVVLPSGTKLGFNDVLDISQSMGWCNTATIGA